jgi:hypothetical protein
MKHRIPFIVAELTDPFMLERFEDRSHMSASSDRT